MKYKIIMAFTFSLLFISCQDQLTSDTPELPYYDVDERLWHYFASFEREAAYRKITIDLNAEGITGVIDNIAEDGVAGTCQYGRHISHVTVDEDYWNNSSSIRREFVVFHELGHCVLDRGHTEDAFANGICKSIMSSGLGTCRDAYVFQNREYYLDELFSLVD